VLQFAGSEFVLLAAGIIGATVMPHDYSLALTRRPDRRRYRGGGPAAPGLHAIDVIVAMSIAGLINLSMLMAAATFYGKGLNDVASPRPRTRRSKPRPPPPPYSPSRCSAPACRRRPSARSRARS
jgi:Mn2+/Fe2+ NRAMP family transporter